MWNFPLALTGWARRSAESCQVLVEVFFIWLPFSREDMSYRFFGWDHSDV